MICMLHIITYSRSPLPGSFMIVLSSYQARSTYIAAACFVLKNISMA